MSHTDRQRTLGGQDGANASNPGERIRKQRRLGGGTWGGSPMPDGPQVACQVRPVTMPRPEAGAA